MAQSHLAKKFWCLQNASTASSRSSNRAYFVLAAFVFALSVGFVDQSTCRAEGEQAEAFLRQLRAARYFDTAGKYLDRLSQYPGVSEEFLQAVPLEKAHTMIDAAVASRSSKDREKFFATAETELEKFLKLPNHARAPEARGQLGKLQMVRAAQSLAGEPDAAAKKQARDYYLAANKTFDSITADLKTKLEALQGVKSKDDPVKGKLREKYYGSFLDSQVKAGDTLILAAKTFDKPATEGKALLEDALKRFETIGTKYRKFVPGIQALVYKGQIHELLGQNDKAKDFFTQMTEEIDADPLREAKYMAMTGIVRLNMKETPPKFNESVDASKKMMIGIRPNEKRLISVQNLRVEVAKAYLMRAADKDTKPTDKKRSKSEGRSLLNDASRVPGPHLPEVKELLKGLGIDAGDEENALPTADPPKSFDDAMISVQKLMEANAAIDSQIALLEEDEANQGQVADLKKQVGESTEIAVQLLRYALPMATKDNDIQTINQARQILAFMLYQRQRYYEAAVVGAFLSRAAPADDMGLKGGTIALYSLQKLIFEDTSVPRPTLLKRLESLGEHMGTHWPKDPASALAKGIRIRLLLQNDEYETATKLIDSMSDGNEKAQFQRLLGQLRWADSVEAKQAGNLEESTELMKKAVVQLQAGLDGIQGGVMGSEVLSAASVLAKIHYKLNNIDDALKTLDHPKYGPLKLLKTIKPPTATFTGDLYSTELKVVVAKAVTVKDPKEFSVRANAVMTKLPDSIQGEDRDKRLTATYYSLAKGVREQLESATPAKRAKLIEVFTDLLKNISGTAKDRATQKWVASTFMEMGESEIKSGAVKVEQGSSAEKLIGLAEATYKDKILSDKSKKDLTANFMHAKCNRLLGNYKLSIDEYAMVLTEKPMMLDAQLEAALSYELWAGTVDPKFTTRAYSAALKGGRPGKDGKNVIWGWGRISQLTRRNPKFLDKFFVSRYHIAQSRFEMGIAAKDNAVIERSLKDITDVESSDPGLGGPEQRAKFDKLMKKIQQKLGKKATGLKPLPAAAQPATAQPATAQQPAAAN